MSGKLGGALVSHSVASIALGLTLAWSSPARAGDATLAESLFREGKQLMQAGDFARACPKLSESYKQDPASGTLLALALCQEKAGQTASAWGSYTSAVARARQEGRSDRESAARDRAAALEPKLSKLTVEVPADSARLPGFSLTRDGVPLPSAAWGSATPVDPGEHVLEANADGKLTWRQSVRVGTSSDRQIVRVGALENAPITDVPATPVPVPTGTPTAPESAGPAPAASPSGSAPPAEASSDGWSALRWVGFVTTSLGLGGLATAGVFAVRARDYDRYSKQDGHCTPTTGCDRSGHALNRDAIREANLATALSITGGALVAGGVTFFILGGSSSAPATASLGMSGLVASDGASLSLSGGF